MKTKFTNSEVPHIWAQQNQETGTGSNIFFEGKTIYSYGHHFPIATFINPTTVLSTTRSYGVSTARHISMTRCALRDGIDVIQAKNPLGAAYENIESIITELERLDIAISRSKSNRGAFIGEKQSIINNALKYVRIAKELGDSLSPELAKN